MGSIDCWNSFSDETRHVLTRYYAQENIDYVREFQEEDESESSEDPSDSDSSVNDPLEDVENLLVTLESVCIKK